MYDGLGKCLVIVYSRLGKTEMGSWLVYFERSPLYNKTRLYRVQVGDWALHTMPIEYLYTSRAQRYSEKQEGTEVRHVNIFICMYVYIVVDIREEGNGNSNGNDPPLPPLPPRKFGTG